MGFPFGSTTRIHLFHGSLNQHRYAYRRNRYTRMNATISFQINLYILPLHLTKEQQDLYSNSIDFISKTLQGEQKK